MELLEEILDEALKAEIPFGKLLIEKGLLSSLQPDHIAWILDTKHNLEYIVHDLMNTGKFKFGYIGESSDKGRFCLMGTKEPFSVSSLPWKGCSHLVLLEQEPFDSAPSSRLSHIECTFLSSGTNGLGFDNPLSEVYKKLKEAGFLFTEEKHQLCKGAKVFVHKNNNSEWFINNKSIWKTIATNYLLAD